MLLLVCVLLFTVTKMLQYESNMATRKRNVGEDQNSFTFIDLFTMTTSNLKLSLLFILCLDS